ncbi:PfkB family carbohydrate kinase [Afifella marina]|uniref:Fructoselysine 6-kinase n=1 Tax=Afifella marina DSM 2698 TaxID=1120955 RepID=A0A1G5NY81_AFIMA|nr:PfkB family carbohydrate kinase [Afifella marina]MBK1624926.1 hypothetical protein [Afifella marina DSM 2698]MBK1628629.1 hypothetical protein [Afifella marina]MBK5916459.1 hypothetical protein [Afifella marina]RAI17717.1 hypothetical protein CH311_17665 [Afifella marina DSM 2698]SCZ42214.1 fructoselysine 6-kinase [Afifella marina DSM 2698]
MSNTEPWLAAVGDNCIDEIGAKPDEGAGFHPSAHLAGGNAVNVAVQAQILGLPSAYFGAVGHDDNGDIIARELHRNGVDTRFLVRQEKPTSVTQVHVTENGERIIALEDFGACAGYRPSEAAFARLLEATHIHIGWFDDGGALKRRLKAAGCSLSQDLSVNNAPEHLTHDALDIAFCSEPGSPQAAETLGKSLLDKGAGLVVVTRGAEGASVISPSRSLHLPAEPISPVDTTGAGDSFIAGFLVARLQGADDAEAARAGIRRASATCLHEGGFPQRSE